MAYVVVGTGEAGIHAALAMRASGYEGELLVIGEEAHAPYTRPPLSKAVLTSVEPALPLIRPLAELAGKRIGIRTGIRVTAIDRAQRQLVCSDGSSQRYEKLVLATGAAPRQIEVAGVDCSSFLYLRTFDQALRIRDSLQPGTRVVLVGGGYIGLEIAASAARRGCQVTVLEGAPSLMARVMAPEVARFFHDLHRSHGVAIHTMARLKSVDRHAEAHRVVLESGKVFYADLLIAGVGATPRTELAERAGLTVKDGIVVDELGQTSDPDIFACGDVASHPNALLARRLRLESWQNAQQQATIVGAALAGKRKPYAVVPWFWSDQYDVNLQMIGCPCAWDEVIVRGEARGRSFTAIYLDRGCVVAGNAINRPKDIAPIRSAIEKQLIPRRESLADPGQPLANVFKEALRRV